MHFIKDYTFSAFFWMLKKVWSVCKHLSKNLKLINRPSQLTTSILSARFNTQMAENASSTSAVFVEKQDR